MANVLRFKLQNSRKEFLTVCNGNSGKDKGDNWAAVIAKTSQIIHSVAFIMYDELS